MGVLQKILNNTGKPQGLLGKRLVNGMNTGRRAEAGGFCASDCTQKRKETLAVPDGKEGLSCKQGKAY